MESMDRGWLRDAGHGVAAAVRSIVAAAATAARSILAATVTAFAAPRPPRSWPLSTRGRITGRRHDVVWLLDLVLAVAVTAATAAAYHERNDVLGEAVGPLLILAAAFGLGIAQVMRDRWPMAAWRLATAVTLASGWLLIPLYDQVPLFPTHALVLLTTAYTAVVRAEPSVAFGVWVVSMVGTAALTVPAEAGAAALPPEGWVAVVLTATAPVVLGHNVRTRRETQAALEAEQGRGEVERAERAVLEERARIARELHDVVAHNMTLVAIQAEAAPLRNAGDAAALAAELASIRVTALAALTETRRILGVLRDDQAAGAQTTPSPGIGSLATLVESARAAGHAVGFRSEIGDGDVSPGVALSIHRIVQESLSNVLRHAPGADVQVVVRREPDARLRIEIVNGPPRSRSGPGQSSATTDQPAGGHGLLGMRERVAMLDGELAAGPIPDGGYRVRVLLPDGSPT